MIKGLKPILITVAVIALIAVSYFLLQYVFVDLGSTAKPAKTTPTPTADTSQTYYVIKEDSSSIVGFEGISSDGVSLRVDIAYAGDGSKSYTAKPENTTFGYDTTKFNSMIYTLSELTSNTLVEENPKDLSLYGLDHPRFTMRVYLSGDRTIELYIGNATPTDKYCYIMASDKRIVYTIGSYMEGLLMRTEMAYRNITLFPLYTGEDIAKNINSFGITLRDGTPINVLLDSNFNNPANTAASAYVMTQPTPTSCDDTQITTLLGHLATLTLNGINCDITKDQYAKYGFDRPARLRMTDTAGNSVDVLVGTVTATYAYMMLSDKPGTVLLCTMDSFDWLNTNYFDLMNRALWLQKIQGVDYVDYDMNGKHYRFDIEAGKTTNSDGKEVDSYVFTLNGQTLSDDNGKRLYSRTLNLRIISNIPANTTLGTPECTITMVLLDGTKRVLQLVKINDRQYGCIMDGKPEFYIYKSNVQTLYTAFERLEDNRDLPLVYNT